MRRLFSVVRYRIIGYEEREKRKEEQSNDAYKVSVISCRAERSIRVRV